MNKVMDNLTKESIFYITPDVKRGIGLEGILPNYHIICTYFDPLIPILRNQGANIFCLNEKIGQKAMSFNNSGRLLEDVLVKDYICRNSKRIPHLLVFKPSIKIDLLCQKEGYVSLVNRAELNDQFEDKINFFCLVKKYFPEFQIPGTVGILEKLKFDALAKQLGLPFVIQFSHGWAGKTTFFITDKRDFIQLVSRFPKTTVKVNKYIDGFTILNNVCIYDGQVLISPSAIQISNIAELLEKPSVTCGRQWPARYLTDSQQEIISKITKKVGIIMHKVGFKGFFGLDFLIDKRNGQIYLSENNARFTASTSFYTKLELGHSLLPLIYYHLAAFLGKKIPVSYEVESSFVGSQIIFRNSKIDVKLFPNINYGVFQKKEKQLIRSNYYPQNLTKEEFIFIRRTQKSAKGEDLELSRIEYRGEVLESENKLRSWIINLFS